MSFKRAEPSALQRMYRVEMSLRGDLIPSFQAKQDSHASLRLTVHGSIFIIYFYIIEFGCRIVTEHLSQSLETGEWSRGMTSALHLLANLLKVRGSNPRLVSLINPPT